MARTAPGGCAYASGAHHVALVVEHGAGAVLTRCVGFDTPTITGEQVLQIAAVEYQGTQYGGSLGKAICQIDYEPQSYPPGCFNATSPYWAMFVSRGGGAWGVSNLGVSSQSFRDGDGEGWRFDAQNGAPAQPPSAAGVCQAAPAPTPVATTAAGSPTLTPAPAAAPLSSPTPASDPGSAPSPSPSEAPTPIPAASSPGLPAVAAATPGPLPSVRGINASSRSRPWGLLAGGLAATILIGLLVFQARRRR